jgi:hypothetical protein
MSIPFSEWILELFWQCVILLIETCREHSVLIYINVRENRKGITYGQSRETDNIGHKTQNADKQSKKHNTEN